MSDHESGDEELATYAAEVTITQESSGDRSVVSEEEQSRRELATILGRESRELIVTYICAGVTEAGAIDELCVRLPECFSHCKRYTVYMFYGHAMNMRTRRWRNAMVVRYLDAGPERAVITSTCVFTHEELAEMHPLFRSEAMDGADHFEAVNRMLSRRRVCDDGGGRIELQCDDEAGTFTIPVVEPVAALHVVPLLSPTKVMRQKQRTSCCLCM